MVLNKECHNNSMTMKTHRICQNNMANLKNRINKIDKTMINKVYKIRKVKETIKMNNCKVYTPWKNKIDMKLSKKIKLYMINPINKESLHHS